MTLRCSDIKRGVAVKENAGFHASCTGPGFVILYNLSLKYKSSEISLFHYFTIDHSISQMITNPWRENLTKVNSNNRMQLF